MLTLIAAHDKNRAIGKDGQIPWHAPEDLKMFKAITEGGMVIMGRKTFESLPGGPLKGRTNVVVTRGFVGVKNGVIYTSLDGAMDMVRSTTKPSFCIGGGEIYRQMLPFADQVITTEVDAVTHDADAFFPELGEEWAPVFETVIRKADPACVLRCHLRNKAGDDVHKYEAIHAHLERASINVTCFENRLASTGETRAEITFPLLTTHLMLISVKAIANELRNGRPSSITEKLAAVSVLTGHMKSAVHNLSLIERGSASLGLSGNAPLMSSLSVATVMMGMSSGIVEKMARETRE